MSIHTNNRHNRHTEYIRAREGIPQAVEKQIVSTPRQSLTAILEPDAKALDWAKATKARFQNAKPLYASSDMGTAGRDPIEGSVPWRDWWEGLA